MPNLKLNLRLTLGARPARAYYRLDRDLQVHRTPRLEKCAAACASSIPRLRS
jgi:hypothetical protein